ncbi:hypothetical protein ALNOE001_00110 [Candidatus Methanobinarius endosymbioticus]|uniref:Right handed beta helix domain-containing protein n=1 Tax=Candidatus Methanobinarius endosymbioticus TaxID=2006182 RepID=A0A366MEA2_9EURY|nr:hypothetical protein ALNOE001_00110 [Candidatus Methanobinarius endosymbioticus]
MNFINNNVTGNYSNGVLLYIYGSNNTNIIFKDNNIAGLDSGVDLNASNLKNANIFIFNNNITGNSTDLMIVSNNATFGNLYLQNNTINSTSASSSAINLIFLVVQLEELELILLLALRLTM